MSNQVCFFLLIVFVFFYHSGFSQEIRKREIHNGNELFLYMDARVEELMNSLKETCKRTTIVQELTNDYKSTDTEALSNNICKQNPRILGYKIELTAVNNGEEARQIGMIFRKKFPDMKVEIDATVRPNYRVMTGSYFTKESASEDLGKIRQHFRHARSVQYRIFCVEAK